MKKVICLVILTACVVIFDLSSCALATEPTDQVDVGTPTTTPEVNGATRR